MTDLSNDTQPNKPDLALPSAFPPEELERLTDDIIVALKTVFDPEIPVDIYELGLIYKIDVDDSRFVNINMTLTAPGCGMGPAIAADARSRVERIPGVRSAAVELVWDPPWSADMMNPVARRKLGIG